MGDLYDQSIFARQEAVVKQKSGQRWVMVALVFIGLLVLAGLAYWKYTHNPDTMIINVNKASVEQLGYLPGVGPEIASKIVSGRPYATPEDLKKVPGIGEKTFEKMKARVTVE